MDSWHVAQVNIARLVAPIDAPEIAEFVAGLDPINTIAEASPGFVWRLKDDTGDATHIEVDPDPLIIMNLTVWDSIDALDAFVRDTEHVSFLRRRREWFERSAEAYFAMWWIPAGTTPTPNEAMERLAHLRANGPSAYAFTFRERYEPSSV